MAPIQISLKIDAPAPLVFDTIADIRNFSKAVADIVRVEFLSDQESGKGTRFNETRKMGNKEFSNVMEVTEYVKNEKIRIVSDSHGTVWDSLFTVADTDGKTELKLVMDARAHQWLPRLLNPFMKGMIRKAIKKDLFAVQKYCEDRNTA